MRSGPWAVGSSQRAVDSGQWTLVSGQWAVGSGHQLEGSGQWTVGGEQRDVNKKASSIAMKVQASSIANDNKAANSNIEDKTGRSSYRY